ncbi:MAG: ABC transporter substrate-binding protein [Jatrophihabitans sp.]
MVSKRVTLAVAAAAVLGLAACSSSSSSPKATTPPAGGSSSAPAATGSSSGGAQPSVKANITIGVGTGAFVAPLATTANFPGLTIKQQIVNSGAAAIPLLLNGQIQFTAADSVGALTAISHGVPIQIVAVAASTGSTPQNDNTGVLVKNGSSIKSAVDLAGKKVGVNGIGNAAQLYAAAAIDKLGGDSTKVHFVELPPPSFNAAVAKGTIDAAVTSEPGLVLGKAAGLHVLFSPGAEALPSSPLFVYVTSKSYAGSHRDVVAAFANDMVKANTYASTHPQLTRNFAAQANHLTPAQSAAFILPQFTPAAISSSALQGVVDLMVKYKTIASPVDLSKALFTP